MIRPKGMTNDLKVGEEVCVLLLSYKVLDACIRCIDP
jgi:hypothetical protein